VVLVPPKNERCKNAVEKPHFRPGSGTADPDERILSDQDQDLEQAEAEGKSRRPMKAWPAEGTDQLKTPR
jgi:hypothetical protein